MPQLRTQDARGSKRAPNPRRDSNERVKARKVKTLVTPSGEVVGYAVRQGTGLLVRRTLHALNEDRRRWQA